MKRPLILLCCAMLLTGIDQTARGGDQTEIKTEGGEASDPYELGCMYLEGRGVPKNETKAIELFKKAAIEENSAARIALAAIYAEGKGVTKDNAKAAEWLQYPNVVQGSAEGYYTLGTLYHLGIEGVHKDEAEAVACYQKAAAQGNASAQNALGNMYAEGSGVSKDEAKAAEWLEKAADQGNTSAQITLGSMYAEGLGVPKDEAKAVEFFQKASVQGVGFGSFKLGLMYHSGRGVPKDQAKAIEWYEKATVQGDSSAPLELGLMYENGADVPKDDVKALEWFLKAANLGNFSATFELGIMYENGTGTPKNDSIASEWYKRAATSGNALAKSELEVMYANGRVVPEYETKFVEWYQPDDPIVGMSRRKLQKKVESLSPTSKGRELEVLTRERDLEGFFIKKLENSVEAPKYGSEKTRGKLQRVIEFEEKALEVATQKEQKARAWLEGNCASGSSLYFYTRHPQKSVRSGYCLIKNDKVISSFILKDIPGDAGKSINQYTGSSWFDKKLSNHKLAYSSNPIVWVTAWDDPAVPATGDFIVNSQGVVRVSIDGPVRGNGKGEYQLSEEQLRKLNELLMALPPTEQRKPTSRFIISFYSQGQWTTRIYDGSTARETLKAILDTPPPSYCKFGSLLP